MKITDYKILPDFVHPNESGCGIIAETIYEVLK